MSIQSLEHFKINEETFGPLHVNPHFFENIDIILFWNQFTVIIREKNDPSVNCTIHYTNFLIENIVLVKNIFLCVDNDSNLHFTILKKKNETKVLEKLEFKTIMKNIISIFCNETEISVLSKKENETCLFVYDVIDSSKMKVNKSFKISLNTTEGIKIFVKNLKYFSIDFIENVFHIELSKTTLELQILFVIIENIIYWSLLEMDSKKVISPSVLYSCPVVINNVCFIKEIQNTIYLSLVTGSMVILCCDIIERCVTTEVIHLNCSIDKIIFFDDSFVYSNGLKLWNTRISQKNDEYNLKHDLIKISMPFDIAYDAVNAHIYCTTFHNIVYKIKSKENKSSSETDDELISVPKELTEIKKIILEIQEETKRNEEILNSIIEEDNYITVLFLNKKQNLISEHIISTFKIIKVKDCIDDNDIILIDNHLHYFEKGVQIYLIEFDVSRYLKEKIDKMIRINSNLWHLDIKFFNTELFYSYNISIPLKNTNIKIALPIKQDLFSLPIKTGIKLIALVPEAFKNDQNFWCVVSTQMISIDSSYYLDCPNENQLKRHLSNKESVDSTEKINFIALKNCGLLLDIKKHKAIEKIQVSYFIKLPQSLEKCGDKFTNCFVKNLFLSQAENLRRKINENDFLNNQKNLRIYILDDFIDISVEKADVSFYKMKISSCNIYICWEMYKFILDIFKSIKDEQTTKYESRCVPHFDYMILQNLRNNMDNIINSSDDPNKGDLIDISEGFYRDIIGILPI